MENRNVAVRVPATSANLGPGFDCLGMALDWWNEVHMAVAPSPEVRVLGEGVDSLGRGEDNLVYKAARMAFAEADEEPTALSIWCENRIPLARGLGSSAAAIVAGLVAASALCLKPLSQECLLQLAVNLEGHADNVAPALLGGCRVVVRDNGDITASLLPLPLELKAVIFVPDMPMPTSEARAVLPTEVTREDAVFNLSRVALLVNALATDRLGDIMIATQDRLHQPAREKIFPAMKYIFRAARAAGALGVFLSGGGSSVLALADSRFMTIGYEMADAADKIGVSGTVRIASPTSMGAHVVTQE